MNISPHLQAQLLRFGRLFAAALIAQLVTLGTGHLGWKVLAGAVVGAVEVAVRQFFPVTPPQAQP